MSKGRGPTVSVYIQLGLGTGAISMVSVSSIISSVAGMPAMPDEMYISPPYRSS